MRESSSLIMMPFLNKLGSKIRYYDPSGEKKEFKHLKNVKFCKNIKLACHDSDLVIIHTEWEEFKAIDFKKILNKKNAKIYDLRNLYSSNLMKQRGFKYYSIGR